MNAQERELAFANLMAKACLAYQVKKLDPATFELYEGALAKYSIQAIEAQLDRHIAESEFFPKVADLRPATSTDRGEQEQEDKIYAYGEPHHQTKNPHGNPHHITIPEAHRRRQLGETIDAYKRRIGFEVTCRMYPEKWEDGRLVRPDYRDPAKVEAFREKTGSKGVPSNG